MKSKKGSDSFWIQESRDLFNPPKMIRHTCRHCRRNPERLMNPNEVIIHVMKRKMKSVILNFLTKGIRQPGKPPHPHSHRSIIAFNIAGGNRLKIRFPGDRRCLAPGTARWTVARFFLG